MSNNDIPPGWSMPDYMAKRVNEVLNNKPLSPEDEPADALDEMARDIALIEPDPQDWGWWVSYLFEKLEEEAERHGKQADYERMMKTLMDA